MVVRRPKAWSYVVPIFTRQSDVGKRGYVVPKFTQQLDVRKRGHVVSIFTRQSDIIMEDEKLPWVIKFTHICGYTVKTSRAVILSSGGPPNVDQGKVPTQPKPINN